MLEGNTHNDAENNLWYTSASHVWCPDLIILDSTRCEGHSIWQMDGAYRQREYRRPMEVENKFSTSMVGLSLNEMANGNTVILTKDYIMHKRLDVVKDRSERATKYK